MKRPKNPESEAAIKYAIKHWTNIYAHTNGDDAVVYLINDNDETVAQIDLRALVRKRQPLTGIKKTMGKIVRGGR
jgi:hypothetical protein